MRKFEVKFTIETNDDGFNKSNRPPGAAKVLRAFTGISPYPSAIVPHDAEITEVSPMKDGYYYGRAVNSQSRFLYKREGGFWFFRAVEDRWVALTTNDETFRPLAYLGPLRDGV